MSVSVQVQGSAEQVSSERLKACRLSADVDETRSICSIFNQVWLVELIVLVEGFTSMDPVTGHLISHLMV